VTKGKKYADLSASERHRQRQRKDMKKRPWGIAYSERIAAGLEPCRHCGSHTDLTFAHLIPHIRGGRLRLDNVTILCGPCNREQNTEEWPHLISLRAEEDAAPPERKWSVLKMQEMGIWWVRHKTPGADPVDPGAVETQSQSPG
jgi:5-methylcytosine-specific restriction endonuclease McrA